MPIYLGLRSGDVLERVNATTGASGRFVIESVSTPIGMGTIETTESQVQPLFIEDENA
jgi:hypothetical protein